MRSLTGSLRRFAVRQMNELTHVSLFSGIGGLDLAAEAAGFLRFETLTLAPFDGDALDPALLTASERDWLNGYHRRVYAQIAPMVPTEVRQWLREVTAAL